MKTFLNAVMAITMICSLTFTAQAQEKTAAGLYNEGLALLKNKDYTGGLALMEQAMEKAGPEDEKVMTLAKKNGAVAAYNAANASLKAKAYDEAITMYEKGIAYNPSNSSNYEGVARALEGKGDKVGAIKKYMEAAEKAIAEGKTDRAAKREKKAQTMVGKLFVAKDYDQAITCGEALLAAKSDVPEVHYYVGKAYGEKGDSTKGVEHTTQAVTLAGDAAPDKYHYALATQLEAAGNNAEAIAAYQKITGEKYKAQADYRISELKK